MSRIYLKARSIVGIAGNRPITASGLLEIFAEVDSVVNHIATVPIEEHEAAVNITAGQTVHGNTTGKLVLAQADSVVNAAGCFLAKDTVLVGFASSAAFGILSLVDWTMSIGVVNLTAKEEYFLSPSTPGMLTTVVPSAPGTVLFHVGTAISPQTMLLHYSEPILL